MMRPLPGLDVPVVDPLTGLMTQVWYEKFQELSRLSYSDGAPYTPVLSTVGGGGTVPTFTQTPLTGRYATIGRIAFVTIGALNTSGGTPGAGTDQLKISLPLPVRAGVTTSRQMVGSVANAGEETIAFGLFVADATTAPLYWQLVSGSKVNQFPIACVNFNDPSRALTWQFFYATN